MSKWWKYCYEIYADNSHYRQISFLVFIFLVFKIWNGTVTVSWVITLYIHVYIHECSDWYWTVALNKNQLSFLFLQVNLCAYHSFNFWGTHLNNFSCSQKQSFLQLFKILLYQIVKQIFWCFYHEMTATHLTLIDTKRNFLAIFKFYGYSKRPPIFTNHETIYLIRKINKTEISKGSSETFGA